MSVYDYQDALKLGTKEYRAAISAGEYLEPHVTTFEITLAPAAAVV